MIPGRKTSMGGKWLRDTEGEEAVIISLALSVGLVILAAVGSWMWNIFTPMTHTTFMLPPREMP